MIPRRHVLAATAAMLLTHGTPAVAVSSSDDILAAILAARRSLTSLRARFRQKRLTKLLTIESDGELTVVTPEHLRYELFPPDDVVYWVTPQGTVHRAKGAKNAVPVARGGLAVSMPDWIALLAGDILKLKSRYEIGATEDKMGAALVRLKPKDKSLSEDVERIALRTNPDKWSSRELVVEQPNGMVTTLEFATNEKNPKIDADRMRPPSQ
ncbi:MAG: outer membrane lipoprotein carrier protein LolA [Polyangiaceae bacterium]|nr:outer membrane lipoprotein carrier protein LolA [Polyangiaceae bacterium]